MIMRVTQISYRESVLVIKDGVAQKNDIQIYEFEYGPRWVEVAILFVKKLGMACEKSSKTLFLSTSRVGFLMCDNSRATFI